MSARASFLVLVCLSSFTCLISQPAFVDSPEKREVRLGVVARGALRHVHSTGRVRRPAGEWKGQQIPGIGEWIMNRAKIPVVEYESWLAISTL